MKFNINDLKILGLDKNREDVVRGCLEIFDDDKFYSTSIDIYFKGELNESQKLAKEFKIKFANEMFSG